MRTLVLLASACMVGGTLEAQATSEGRARTVERDARRAEEAATAVQGRMLERFMMVDSAAMNRATLGLMLGGSPTKRDTLGVFVEGVAEDGPAERAGIYEGHRIAFINNVDVRASAADAGDPYLSSVGQHRLMRVMRDLTAGNVVTLRVWTGSGYRDVQVTTAKYADVFKNQRFGAQWQGSFGPGAMSFGPALERMKIEAPMLREFHVQPPREVRIESRPRERARVSTLRAAEVARSVREALPTPRAPRVLVAPSVQVAPGAISVPRLAPTPSARRRFVI